MQLKIYTATQANLPDVWILFSLSFSVSLTLLPTHIHTSIHVIQFYIFSAANFFGGIYSYMFFMDIHGHEIAINPLLAERKENCFKILGPFIKDHFMVSKVWDWSSTSVKLVRETNFFFFSWKSNIDKNWSLNYHNTTCKNYKNLLQKLWFCHSHVSCFLRGDYVSPHCPTMQAIGKILKKFEETGVFTNIEKPVHHNFAENIAIASESAVEDRMCRFLIALRN